jgi:tRNA dimethylallyltransferase
MQVLAVFGPTASGKSDAAMRLAERVGGEIVNCDAMQMYAGLPVLTNQPPAQDMARVPHHLIAIWPPEHEGSVAEYAPLAHAAVDDVIARGRVPVVVGGTGLYLRAALAELHLPPRVATSTRRRFEQLYDRRGSAATHALLAAADPRAAAAVHPHDRRRVVRALELHESGASLVPESDRLWSADLRRPARVFGLDLDPGVVRSRIAERTRAMFLQGVEEEVRDARLAHRFSATAERIHGLQDITDLLEGRIDRNEAARRLELRTRRYAKRQRVWMRRIPGLEAVSSTGELLAAL